MKKLKNTPKVHSRIVRTGMFFSLFIETLEIHGFFLVNIFAAFVVKMFCRYCLWREPVAGILDSIADTDMVMSLIIACAYGKVEIVKRFLKS
jgi:hypothetical protein